MRLLTYTCLLLAFIHHCYSNFEDSTDHLNKDVVHIKKYTVSIPETFLEHTMGFSPGLGSSITLKQVSDNGHIQLYSICDRGPNQTINAPRNQNSTIVFPIPTFSPFIGIINIIPEKSAILTEIITLKTNNEAMTGLPPTITIDKGENISIPTDFNFKPLPMDLNGIDPESLDIDEEGNFWFGDEYGPRILKADSSGKILEILTPGHELPAILKNGLANRGFEALAVAPNNKIYAVMESILDVNGKTKNSANFIRMIEIDPLTHQTRTFAYPFDQNTYRSNSDVKIGDLAAIDDTHFLLVEQGLTKSGMRNIIYIIDIADAIDISNIHLPQESISPKQSIKKIKLFDAQQFGWDHEKLEGLAIINENTIAITHDNDFGLSLSINGVNSHHVEGYTVDYNSQKLLRYGEVTEDEVKMDLDENAHTWIWIVNFKNSFLNIIEQSRIDSNLSDSLQRNENLSDHRTNMHSDQIDPATKHTSLQNLLIK